MSHRCVHAGLAGFACLAILFSSTANADLVAATSAYKSGNYAKAFKDFTDLAELGQPQAQFDLAVMYLKGQGTATPSNTYAYAWALLAQENGVTQAGPVVQALRSLLTPVSLQIAGEIHDQFDQKALQQRLLPEVLTADDPKGRGACHFIGMKVGTLPYPDDAQRRGIEGSVNMELTVLSDGHAHVVQIIDAVPAGVFEDAAREAALHLTYFITPDFGSPTAVNCTRPQQFIFRILGATKSDYGPLDSYTAKLLRGAKAGDSSSQVIYGMLLEGLPQLRDHREEALPWFLQAAQAGSPVAQFEVGFHVLNGLGCQCNDEKAIDWLQRASASDEPHAQITLATYFLRGTPNIEDTRKALLWLERAVAAGNGDAMLFLASVLAAAPFAEIRDPQRALKLLRQIPWPTGDDPNFYEVRAAAQAQQGDFKAAIDSQTRALHTAKWLRWDTAPQAGRLARYRAHQAWQGSLLPF